MNAPTSSDVKGPARKRRSLVFRLLAVPVLLLAAAGLFVLALQSATVRQSVLERVSHSLEDATGIRAGAADFALHITSGVLELRDVTLATGDAEPFLTAAGVLARFDWGALFGDFPVLQALEVERPVADLDRPLPPSSDEPLPRVDILDLKLSDGELRSTIETDESATEPWIRAWSAAHVSIAGSLIDSRVDLTLAPAQLELQRGETLRLEAATHISGPLVAGPWKLDALTVTADGLRLEGAGELGKDEGQPLFLDVELEADAAFLMKGLEGGTVTADGEIDLRTFRGAFDVTAQDVPSEAFEPWIGAAARPGGASSRFDIEARFESDPDAVPQIQGHADLEWRQNETLIAEARMTLTDGHLDDDGPVLDSLVGEIHAGGRDVPAEILRAGLDPEHVELLAMDGTQLDFTADVVVEATAPSRPSGHADLTWRRRGDVLLRATADTIGGEDLRLDVTADLLPAAPGRRHLMGQLASTSWPELVSGELHGTSLELTLPELDVALADLRDRWPRLFDFDPGATPLPLDGPFEATATLTDHVDAPTVTLDAAWAPAAGGRFTVAAEGDPLARSGEATVEFEALDLALFGETTSGHLDGKITAQGSPASWTADLQASGRHVGFGSENVSPRGEPRGGETVTFDELRVEAETDGTTVDIRHLAGRRGPASFEGHARAALATPLGTVPFAEAEITGGSMNLTTQQPFTGIDSITMDARLEDGSVVVERFELAAPTGQGELEGRIPLGSLRAFKIDVDAWPVKVFSPLDPPKGTAEDGMIVVDLDIPRLDIEAIARDLGQDTPWTVHEVGLTGRVWIDPSDPTVLESELLAEHWLLQIGPHRFAVADDPILLGFGDHRLDVVRVELQADGHPLAVEAGVDLVPGWSFGDAWADVVGAFDLQADGTIDTGILTRYLAGGVAEGPAVLKAEVSGTLDRLGADLRFDGSEASLTYATPYLTRIEAPQIELHVADGVWTFDKARGRLNDGSLELDAQRSSLGDWTVEARVEDARYVFDYGLNAILDSRDLRLELPAEGRGRLSGRIEVERGVQRRALDLDREILSIIFGPPDIEGAEASALEDIDLELTVATAAGVRVKNNLADLRATWEPFEVTGTLAVPAVEGRLEVERDGLLFVYGQTLRVDRGEVIFTGDPGQPPILDFETTSSLDDPTIGAADQSLRLTWRSVDLRSEKQQDDPGTEDVLAEGLAGYVGGRLVSRLGGRTRLRLRPILVFGETDPTANLVISRELSSAVELAAAVDLRDSQRQTYLLELHDLPKLRRTSFQVFTQESGATTENDDRGGATVQQTVLFPRHRALAGERRLRDVTFEGAPAELSASALRRAVGYAKGEILPEAADFEIEVDVAAHLRERGYPGAAVRAELTDTGSRSADLRITIEPGPHVIFEWSGETPPPVALRRTITEPYRLDFYQEASIEEMRLQAVRVLRNEGYVDPQVEIETPAVDGAPADGASQTVAIRSNGGRRTRVDRLVFAGLDAADAAVLERRLATRVASLELAAAVPTADEWLRRNLQSLGYPRAVIASRRLSENGRELVVEIDAGPRQEIAEVRIDGVSATDAEVLLDQLPVRRGDVPRTDRVAAGSLTIRGEWKRRGYADIRVRSRVEAVDEGSSMVAVIYDVEPGARYQLEAVEFAGIRSTRKRWARRLSGLESGTFLDPDRVGQGQRLLTGTRLFESVRGVSERADDGTAVVTYEVEEAPRFQLSYGLRWGDTQGVATVVDLVDRNFLGRGITLGLRGLYSERDRAGRFYAGRSNLFGRKLSIDFFLEERHEETSPTQEFFDDSLLVDSVESSLQVSFPLGRHLTGRVYGRFKREEIREKFPFDPIFPFEETIRFPFMGWQVLYDTRDDKVAPTRGFFISADLSASDEAIESDFNFVRLFTQLQWMRPAFRLGGRRLTWAQSYRIGLFTSTDDFPLSTERFRAGGEYSVRGYGEESLTGGTDLGGDALFVINQELRFPIWGDRIAGLVFFDLGNVWEEKGDFGSDFLTATGIGLRADTPIGFLRLDVGIPLDRRGQDSSIRTYFGFGHAF